MWSKGRCPYLPAQHLKSIFLCENEQRSSENTHCEGSSEKSRQFRKVSLEQEGAGENAVARMWLGCGSDVARVARMWLGCGSDVARMWLGWLGCGSATWLGCGSDVARMWLGWLVGARMALETGVCPDCPNFSKTRQKSLQSTQKIPKRDHYVCANRGHKKNQRKLRTGAVLRSKLCALALVLCFFCMVRARKESFEVC